MPEAMRSKAANSAQRTRDRIRTAPNVTLIVARLFGGLGNQMFQYARRGRWRCGPGPSCGSI